MQPFSAPPPPPAAPPTVAATRFIVNRTVRLTMNLLLLATAVAAESGSAPAPAGPDPEGPALGGGAGLRQRGGPCGSPCHCAMEKYCNASAATPAECVACEAKHKAALQHAGCDGGPGSKLARFCGGAPTPPGPARPPAPAPPPTPDCPNGVANPCKEPATPKISSGFASYNLFWPLAHPNPSHRHHTRTPHTSFANQHRRVQGRAGCRGSRVQLHLLPKRRLGKRIPAGGRGWVHAGGLLRVQRHPRLRAPRQCAGRCRPRSCHPELQRGLREDIGRSCPAKYFSWSCHPSDPQTCFVEQDGGSTWTKIRRFGGKPGMINYDRVHNRVLLQYPDRYYAPNPGAVVQVTSPDGAHHRISRSHHATRPCPLTDGRWCRR